MTTKPYWDKIVEAEMKENSSEIEVFDSSRATEERELWAEDFMKVETAMKAVRADFYKAMQDMTPPEELKAYHAIMLEMSAKAVTYEPNKQQVMTELEKLDGEARKEFAEVLKRHGVPQNIIDGLLKVVQRKEN